MALQVSQANSKSTDYLVKPSALDSGTFPPPDNDDDGRQGYSRGSEKSLASSVPALNDYDEDIGDSRPTPNPHIHILDSGVEVRRHCDTCKNRARRPSADS